MSTSNQAKMSTPSVLSREKHQIQAVDALDLLDFLLVQAIQQVCVESLLECLNCAKVHWVDCTI